MSPSRTLVSWTYLNILPRAEETKEMESSKNREPPGYHKKVSYLNGSKVCFPFPVPARDIQADELRVILFKDAEAAGINGVRGIIFPVPLE